MAGRRRGQAANRKGPTKPDELATLMASEFELEPTSSIPLYHQLALILQRGIRELELEPGAKFPTEESIAETFSVSRPTANRAILELTNRQWLVRKRGKGTFVSRLSPVSLSVLDHHLSFAELMSQNPEHNVEIIKQQLVPATPHDVGQFSIRPSSKVVWIRRLRRVGQSPMMVSDSRLPADRFPKLETIPLVENSLYRTLDARYGCRVTRAERCVEAAGLLNGDVAELLGIPRFGPILFLTGLGFASTGEVVQHLTAYVREGISFKNVVEPGGTMPLAGNEGCPRFGVAQRKAC